MQQSVPSTDDGKSKIVKFMEIFFNTSRNLLVFQIHILMMPLIGESLDCNIIFLVAVLLEKHFLLFLTMLLKDNMNRLQYCDKCD